MTREYINPYGFVDQTKSGFFRAYSFDRRVGIGPFPDRDAAIRWTCADVPFQPMSEAVAAMRADDISPGLVVIVDHRRGRVLSTEYGNPAEGVHLNLDSGHHVWLPSARLVQVVLFSDSEPLKGTTND